MHQQTKPRAAALKTKFGFKALVIHPSGRNERLASKHRLSLDGRDTVLHRAAKNWPTREEAISFAEMHIAAVEQATAIATYRFTQTRLTGRRPSEDDARAALSLARGEK